jgi:meiotic recombination protein SPO11
MASQQRRMPSTSREYNATADRGMKAESRTVQYCSDEDDDDEPNRDVHRGRHSRGVDLSIIAGGGSEEEVGLHDKEADADEECDESDKEEEENDKALLTHQDVLHRMEQWIIEPILAQLNEMESPSLPSTGHCQPIGHGKERGEDDDDDKSVGSDAGNSDANDDVPVRRRKKRKSRSVSHAGGTTSFSHNVHCRRLTSILLVTSYCHELLQHGRITATLREVYYYFCTHFRSQSECNAIIQHVCDLLRVQRVTLGILASPKGWWSGCLTILDKATNQVVAQGRDTHQSSSHGIAITGTPIEAWRHEYTLQAADAKCIVVIESEGVYSRLAEERFWMTRYPCILVTGKGFPDFATRTWVQYLQQQLHLPAYALCDCNPYGVSAMQTYTYFQKNSAMIHPASNTRLDKHPGSGSQDHLEEGQGYDDNNVESHNNNRPLDLTWIGLRPSQLDDIHLPSTVLQELTDMDHKRLEYLLKDEHRPYCHLGTATRSELLRFADTHPHKVELEALHWKGMDYLCNWLHQQLLQFEHLTLHGTNEGGTNEQSGEESECEAHHGDDDDDDDVDGSNVLSSYRI